MHDLPERTFSNPVWHALNSKHRRFSVTLGAACRYPADVVPFAALETPSVDALRQMLALLAPGESVWLVGGGYPQLDELPIEETMECLQMVLPKHAFVPDARSEVVRLSTADAAAMVQLTTLAFPGFFRARTCEMGSYFGVRSAGQLVAMGGERLMLDGFVELSGICTHPRHRGQGFAAGIIGRLVREQRREGLVSWLHVAAGNSYNVEFYRRLGFEAVRTVTLTRFRRR